MATWKRNRVVPRNLRPYRMIVGGDFFYPFLTLNFQMIGPTNCLIVILFKLFVQTRITHASLKMNKKF
jgi:hypothetical protein